MKKGSLDLTIKAMFALFIILFVLFIGFSVLGTRTDTLGQEAEFAQQRTEQSFFLNLLGSPCLSVVDKANKSVYVETQGFLSQTKLDRGHLGNEDLRCAENYNFLYSVKVLDDVNGKEWLIGIMPNEIFGNSRTLALPSSILYDLRNTTIPTTNIARVFFTRYDGALPRLYGKLKEVCRSRASDSISLNLPLTTVYDNESNVFIYGNTEFYPYFGCAIGAFNLSYGRHLIYFAYSNGKVNVN
ncbi:MAG: hypothetical protein AABX51_07065 [Nanoarchaeota archaeon]